MQSTDYGALGCAPSTSRRARWVYVAHQVIVIGGLLGGGMSIGYFAGVQSTREAASEEIERLQYNHQTALDAITGRLVPAAARIEATASTVSDAADNVAAAAEVAQGAAAIAGKAAKAAGVPAAALEQDRRAINNTINRANERIRDGAGR